MMKMQGGLGNQLFQYSLGRHLAYKNKTELLLDISWYAAIPDRQYDLDVFNISASIASTKEIRAIKGSLLAKIRQHFRPNASIPIVREQSFRFDPAILDIHTSVYLEGYWQSAKYFTDIADIIRRDLTLKHNPTGKNATLFKQIQDSTAVSLHVRRGDYVTNKRFNQYHGVTSLDYYRQAVDLIAKKVSKPHFYIFSDDPKWVENNIKLHFPTTFVTHNGDRSEEDLRLMSHCQHFIIANSTFSWWGAWLSKNPQKTVIAPKAWFNQKNADTKHLIPQSWVRL